MNRLNKVLSCILLIGIIATVGCLSGGGSGGSASSPADVAGITSSVNGFMRALVKNDNATMKSFLASPESCSDCIYYLRVHDFGHDITDSSDDGVATFTVSSSEIVQAGDVATVIARYNESEPPIVITFELIKEGGKWIIQDMTLGDLTVTPTYSVANYLPLATGNEWVYEVKDVHSGSTSTPEYRKVEAGTAATWASGTFFPLTSTTSTSATSIRADFFDSSKPDGMSYLSVTDGLHFHGERFVGAQQSIKLLDSSFKAGDTTQHLVTLSDGSNSGPATITVTVLSPTTLSTEAGSFPVFPVQVRTHYSAAFTGSSDYVRKLVFYVASNVGIVGKDYYSTDETTLFYTYRLKSAKVGSTVYPIPTPVTPPSGGRSTDQVLYFWDYLPMTDGNNYWYQTYVNDVIQSNDRKNLYRSGASYDNGAGQMMQDFYSDTYIEGTKYSANFFNTDYNANRDAFGTDSNGYVVYWGNSAFYGTNQVLALFPETMNLPVGSYTGFPGEPRVVGGVSTQISITLSRNNTTSYEYAGQTFTDTLLVSVSEIENGSLLKSYNVLLAKNFGPIHRMENQSGGTVENRLIYAILNGSIATPGQTPPPEASTPIKEPNNTSRR